MTEKLVIQAQDRKALGKRYARFYRTQDHVLAVMYNTKIDSIPLLLPNRTAQQILNFPDCFNRVWDMQFNDEKYLVILHKVERHVVNNKILHVDFIRVTEDDYVSIKVPIALINQNKCPGLKTGGVLNVNMREADLKCPAKQIPSLLEFDLSVCNIGDSIHIKDLTLPADAKWISNKSNTVFSITAPQSEEKEELQEASMQEKSDSDDKPEDK